MKQLIICSVLILILCLLLISTKSIADLNNCLGIHNIEDYYGKYKVFDITEYRGGLIDRHTVEQDFSKSIIISNELFRIQDTYVIDPEYTFHCYKYPLPKGEVDANRWSYFYGYETDREVVTVLNVKNLDKNATVSEFEIEILNNRELWYLFDAWLIKFTKVNNYSE